MANLGNFNANDFIEEEKDFSPIPAGDYPVMVESTEMKTTKAGTGKYVSAKIIVLDGKSKGRVLFTNFNIENPNPEAAKIGRSQLANLVKACGLESIVDTSQLHSKPIIARVTIKPASGGYDASNEIKRFFPIAPVEPVDPEVVTVPSLAGKKPWE
jgi:hypothetical protein